MSDNDFMIIERLKMDKNEDDNFFEDFNPVVEDLKSKDHHPFQGGYGNLPCRATFEFGGLFAWLCEGSKR